MPSPEPLFFFLRIPLPDSERYHRGMEELVAPADYPVDDLVRRRFSPRAFSDRPVTPQILRSLLEAARWAPSSFNEQPWSFLVATHAEPVEFARLLSCLVEKNQLWAKHAPVLMLSVAAKHFARNGKPNRHAVHDVGASAAWLTVQATALGLFVHQMAGIDVEKARQTYAVPDTHDVIAGIAVGYRGYPDTLPEEFRKKETVRSTRKPQGEFVFTGQWGRAL
jgi:nitroreductase